MGLLAGDLRLVVGLLAERLSVEGPGVAAPWAEGCEEGWRQAVTAASGLDLHLPGVHEEGHPLLGHRGKAALLGWPLPSPWAWERD